MKKDILINTIDTARRFNEKAMQYECDIDLISGRYIIDAKSIMGIFSLDLSEPITMSFDENVDEILDDFKEFFIKEN